ncbi:MAG: GNAT family N-acetyltransferase [Ruminococcus sp.]|nr:GNAT family N-acetyltransferase [Ruminococcus sp.]
MIKKVKSKTELTLGEDYYKAKICAYMDAYGAEYDFCRFYCERGSLAGGNIMLLNSAAVISGTFTDIRELEEFITMNAPQTLEMPKGVAARLNLGDYERQRRVLYRIKIPDGTDTEEFKKGLDEPVSLQDMFMILNACFSGLSFDGWYADMSHRVRHGVSEVFTYKHGVCGAVDFKSGSNAFVSSIATVPAMRGKGYAGNMLGFIAGRLKNQRYQGYLWADGSSEGYYKKLGFTAADEDEIFVRKK